MPDYTPLALQHLDSTLGSRTVEAYEVATEQHPHLGGIAVKLDSSHSFFEASNLGLAGSHISMLADKPQYINHIKSGATKARMADFSKLLREKGVTPSVPELVTSVFLHELGHAEDYHQYIQRAGGDVKAAFRTSREIRKSEIARLPLGIASSRALRAWNTNTNGYRDSMTKAGHTQDSFMQLINRNIEAYAKLPSEQIADRFALGVLATMYS